MKTGLHRVFRACLAVALLLYLVGCDGSKPLAPEIQAAATAGSGPAVNAPSNTHVVAVSESRIDVFWQDNATNETGFEIHRSTSGAGGSFALWAEAGSNVTTYNDLPLNASTEYCYKIAAFRAGGHKRSYSAFSTAACATTLTPPPPPPPPPTEPPPAPSFTDATPSSSSQVVVRWADNSTTEDGFRLERSLDAGATWTSAGTLAPDAIDAVDDGRSSEQPVCYRVVAFNATGESPSSHTDCTTPPAGPTDLILAGEDSLAWTIDLTWTDNSAVEDGYQVWACGSFEGRPLCGPVDLLPADSTKYQFQRDGFSDTFWVVATRDGGRSDPSNLVTTPLP